MRPPRGAWVLLAGLAALAAGVAAAAEPPLADRPVYGLGEEWFRSDGAYELVRVENDRYIYVAGEDREIRLTKELAVARAQRGTNVMEFDPPPKLTWPLEVGASGSSQGTWRNPANPGGRTATFAWGVDAYEDLQVPAGAFKAFRIHLNIGWAAGRGRGQQGRSFQFTFWYAPEARRFVKARGERPGLLDFELTDLDRSGPPPQTAGQGPAPLAASGAVTPGGVPGGAKRYGLEFLDVLEAFRQGEGREALVYYEVVAERRERQGVRLEAAKAHSAVTFTASRLGAYQKAIRSGLRALELFKLGASVGRDSRGPTIRLQPSRVELPRRGGIERGPTVLSGGPRSDEDLDKPAEDRFLLRCVVFRAGKCGESGGGLSGSPSAWRRSRPIWDTESRSQRPSPPEVGSDLEQASTRQRRPAFGPGKRQKGESKQRGVGKHYLGKFSRLFPLFAPPATPRCLQRPLSLRVRLPTPMRFGES